VTLFAPSNTASVLHPSPRPEASPWTTDKTWKLMTVRNWGEDPVGNWTISIIDKAAGNRPLGDCVDKPFQGSSGDENGQTDFINCFGLEAIGWCRDGSVLRPSIVEGVVDEISKLRADEQCCACGGGASAGVGTCYDDTLRLEVQNTAEGEEGFTYVGCSFIEDSGICVDGVALDPTASYPDVFGITAEEACCSCGGGSTITDTNALVSWELVVYGHSL
jgi:Proprotein convertase P-domain